MDDLYDENDIELISLEELEEEYDNEDEDEDLSWSKGLDRFEELDFNE